MNCSPQKLPQQLVAVNLTNFPCPVGLTAIFNKSVLRMLNVLSTILVHGPLFELDISMMKSFVPLKKVSHRILRLAVSLSNQEVLK